MATTDPKEITKKIEERLKQLASKDVLIGVPKEKKRKNEKGEDEEIFLADIAHINNFGSYSKNIPSRPFGTTTIPKYESEIQKLIRREYKEALVGRREVDTALDRIGAVAAGFMRKNLNDGEWEPNAQITIDGGWMRTKQGKPFFVEGKGSDKPLVDKGQLQQSITWVVRDDVK